MTRILFVAYHFPPLGGAGVQRAVKLVRYLPEFGYEPVVVSGGARPGHWTPPDVALAGEVSAAIEVLRPSTPEPPPTGHRRARLERWLGLEQRHAGWWRSAATATARSAEGVELVFATMSPWESGEAAAAVARERRLPLVLDLRDPWALDEMTIYPTRLHRRAEARRMRQLLAQADAVVMNTDEARTQLEQVFPELAGRFVVTITNGYDSADFASAAPPTRGDGVFRIVHAGFLHSEARRLERRGWPRRALGGARSDVDFTTRSHVHLLHALDVLVRRRPDLALLVELQLVGELTQHDRLIAARSPFVRTPGYLSHPETVAFLRSADLLFLPMHDLAPGARATIVPGKTYEYLAAGVPILAAVPPGDARDLLLRAGDTLLCDPADADAMAHLIEAAVDRWRRGERPALRDPALLGPYERRRLAGELAGVFDRVLSTGVRRPTGDLHTRPAFPVRL